MKLKTAKDLVVEKTILWYCDIFLWYCMLNQFSNKFSSCMHLLRIY